MRRKVLSIVSAMLLTGALAFGVNKTTITGISIVPNAIPMGSAATATATVQDADGSITCGAGTIRYQIHDALNTQIVGWTVLASHLPVSANQFSAVFDTTLIPLVAAGDKVTMDAQFDPGGGAGTPCGGSFNGVGLGQSPTSDLLIEALPTSFCPNNQTTGVFVSIDGPKGLGAPPLGYSGTWSFVVTVLACEDVYDVSAQGGSNGWTTSAFEPPSQGAVTPMPKNKNTVYLWTIGSLPAGKNATLTVDAIGSIKNSPSECGKAKLLNGDWSAMYAEAPGGIKAKSAYTAFTAAITPCQ
jgi:hypothetical protein